MARGMQRSMRHGSRYKRLSGTTKLLFRASRSPSPQYDIEKYIGKG